MPYTVNNPPSRIKKLPKHAQEIWISAYNSAYEQYNKNEAKANAVAWAAVKKKYKKVGNKWKRKASESKMIANPIDLEFAESQKEIEILKTGDWDHPSYGPIKITDKDLDDFVKNFNKGIRNDLPINVEHSSTDGAVGWFKKMFKKGKSLFAKVEWTKQGRQLLKDKVFKYFSPEFYSTYDDPETRKIYKNVLVGGALTNTPYFKGLKAIVFSELINDMTLKEILTKEVEDLTDEEKETLKKHQEQLTDDQKEKFKKVFEEEEETEEETEEEEEENTEETQDREEEEEEETADDKDKVELSETKLKILERNAEAGVKAMAELKRQQASEFVKSMIFSESNPKGRILSKSKDKVVEFLLSLSDKQTEGFKEIIGELPTPNKEIFGEVGGDESGATDPVAKFNELVQSKRKENSKLSYRQAMDLVEAEDPELAKQASEGR